MIASVAYATDERASEENTGRPKNGDSFSWWACAEAMGAPSSVLLNLSTKLCCPPGIFRGPRLIHCRQTLCWSYLKEAVLGGNCCRNVRK